MMKTYEDHISEIDQELSLLISRAEAYMWGESGSYVRDQILLAYDFSKEAHKDDVRLSWEPYIAHPVAATKILLSLNPDISTIQACLLHDVIEDTVYTYDDILEAFWEDVAELCNGMSKLEKVKYRWEERAVGSLRKMFVAMADDLRVIFIKLSDRLHNMQTLHHHPKPDKRDRIALETLNIYVPIAARLGLYQLKNNLEDECFKILHPEEYTSLIWDLKKLEASRIEFKNSSIIEIQRLLSKIDIAHKVDFRIKSPYSIYKKMHRKGLKSPYDLYDIYGVRIVVPNVADCYRVLWEIHSTWHTLPYRFKDYIALPKPNGYQSIHTTVVGFLKKFTKQPTEIQIRTEHMHTRAEIGIAAHFEYKEKWSKISKEISWVWDLKDLVDSVWNNDLIQSLKIDTFKDRIFVFTPRGDLINLPAWSTAIDFAYHVHTDLWDHISIAKVNGWVYPLDKELSNGDIIEVIVDKNRKPSPFWLGFVKTIKAKNNIKTFLRKGDKELHRDRGKEIINKYLEKSWLSPLDKDMTVLKIIDGRWFNTEERWQLLEQVWNFSITPASLLKRILKELQIAYEPKNKNSGDKDTESTAWKSALGSWEVVIGWEEDIPYKKCKVCMKNESLDQIVSHINSRWHFTIHKRNCSVLKWVNPQRLMNAYVKGEESFSVFRLSLTVENKLGMMKTISEALFQMEINIDELHSKKISEKQTVVVLSLEILDYNYLIVDRFVERMQFILWDALISHRIEKIKHYN